MGKTVAIEVAMSAMEGHARGVITDFHNCPTRGIGIACVVESEGDELTIIGGSYGSDHIGATLCVHRRGHCNELFRRSVRYETDVPGVISSLRNFVSKEYIHMKRRRLLEEKRDRLQKKLRRIERLLKGEMTDKKAAKKLLASAGF